MRKPALDARAALGLIHHGPVVLVTARDGRRTDIITVAWVAPVSGEPPMVAVAISPRRFSHGLIRRSGEFVVNVPSSGLLAAVWLCGSLSGRDTDKFEAARLTAARAQSVGAPLIAECFGHLECRVEKRVTAGDHTVFVGRVVAPSADRAAFGKHLRLAAGSHTLHHIGGRRFLTSAGTVLEAGKRAPRRRR